MRRIVMARVGEKGREQVKRRIDSARLTIDNELNTLRKTVDTTLEIKPVQAAVELVVGTIDNIGSFIRKQADLTRERAR